MTRVPLKKSTALNKRLYGNHISHELDFDTFCVSGILTRESKNDNCSDNEQKVQEMSFSKMLG